MPTIDELRKMFQQKPKSKKVDAASASEELGDVLMTKVDTESSVQNFAKKSKEIKERSRKSFRFVSVQTDGRKDARLMFGMHQGKLVSAMLKSGQYKLWSYLVWISDNANCSDELREIILDWVHQANHKKV